MLGKRFPSFPDFTITASGGRKIKEQNLMTVFDFVFYAIVRGRGEDRGKSINQENIQIIGGMQPNYLGVYFPHPPRVCKKKQKN